MPIGTLQEIVFECPNPEALARFWQALIGGDVDVDSDDCAVLDGDDEGFFMRFQRSEARKSFANQISFDIEVDDLALATDEAEQFGGRKVGEVVDDGEGGSVQVMADPAGNEYSFVAP